ncbi:MAG: DnaD domain protein [Bacillota bacterium]|nr:DnaD domain protein [Bacillota bacterium]
MYFESFKSIIFSDTIVPDIFINEYMPSMDGDHVKVYLNCLFLSKHGKCVSGEELAAKLGMSSDKIKEAFLFLESTGLISKKGNSLVFTDLKEKEINKLYRLKTTSSPEEAAENFEKNSRRNSVIAAINNNFFQGLMPPSWYTDIDNWFERYKFDEDVMYSLFDHCKNNNGLSKNYVAVVAANWYDKGIKTSFDVDNYSLEYQKFKDIRSKVFKKLKRKVPFTEYEEKCIEKWVSDYCYDFEIIEIALKKTIAKPEATLKYIDVIITDWYKNGLKTQEEILIYDAKKKHHSTKHSKESQVPQKGNFDQRKYDDDYYESLYDNVRKSKTV